MFDAFVKNNVTPLLLRLALAAVFIYHGLDLVNGEGNEWGAAWARKIPSPPSMAVQAAVAWGELIGGIALALGFLTRLAALGIAVIMGGAIATVHWPHGFDIRQNGFEYNFAIIMVCLCLILSGGGSFAVDRFFHLRRGHRPS